MFSLNELATILFVLTVVHFLYDWHIQGWLGEAKRKYKIAMHVHCITWALVLTSVLFYFNFPNLLITFIFLWVTHYFVDTWKIRKPEYMRDSSIVILIDQAAHLLTVLLVLVTYLKI